MAEQVKSLEESGVEGTSGWLHEHLVLDKYERSLEDQAVIHKRVMSSLEATKDFVRDNLAIGNYEWAAKHLNNLSMMVHHLLDQNWRGPYIAAIHNDKEISRFVEQVKSHGYWTNLCDPEEDV